MKKLIIGLALFSTGIFSVNAQDFSRNALGLRLGDNDGIGYEISYQRELDEVTRIELDLGIRNHSSGDKFGDAFKLTGIYQWVWNIDGGFNWYAGFGAGIGSWSSDSNVDDGLFINADGNVGIEYNFDIPIMLSIDFRPEFGLVGDYGDGTDLDLALSIRYQF